MPDCPGRAEAQYYIDDDTGRPIEELGASTLSGAVAEAGEIAMETALEDACRFGSTSGQDWKVYARDGLSGEYTLEASGAERADAGLVARMSPLAAQAARPGASARPAHAED